MREQEEVAVTGFKRKGERGKRAKTHNGRCEVPSIPGVRDLDQQRSQSGRDLIINT